MFEKFDNRISTLQIANGTLIGSILLHVLEALYDSVRLPYNKVLCDLLECQSRQKLDKWVLKKGCYLIQGEYM